MALKFLNKKGWHTGSLRNIENVWKVEQKHAASRKSSRSSGNRTERNASAPSFASSKSKPALSRLAVGKGSSGFKLLESSLQKNEPEAAASSSASAKQQSAIPGVLMKIL